MASKKAQSNLQKLAAKRAQGRSRGPLGASVDRLGPNVQAGGALPPGAMAAIASAMARQGKSSGPSVKGMRG